LPDSRFALTIRGRYDFAMSAILKDEEFVAVEAAVKAGVAPQRCFAEAISAS
jgi:hypothetical protein